jgi:hypothetical protein
MSIFSDLAGKWNDFKNSSPGTAGAIKKTVNEHSSGLFGNGIMEKGVNETDEQYVNRINNAGLAALGGGAQVFNSSGSMASNSKKMTWDDAMKQGAVTAFIGDKAKYLLLVLPVLLVYFFIKKSSKKTGRK